MYYVIVLTTFSYMLLCHLLSLVAHTLFISGKSHSTKGFKLPVEYYLCTYTLSSFTHTKASNRIKGNGAYSATEHMTYVHVVHLQSHLCLLNGGQGRGRGRGRVLRRELGEGEGLIQIGDGGEVPSTRSKRCQGVLHIVERWERKMFLKIRK